MKTRHSILRRMAGVGVIQVLLLAAATGAHAETVALGQLGCEAPKLEGLEWVKGDAVEMRKGSIYVLEFWATWCGPCIKGIPHLTELQHAYQDRNVTVIGISAETNGKVRPFVEKQGKAMDYTVAIDAGGKMSEGYMKAFNQGGIPHAFIVDASGRVAWRGHPMTMDEPLEQIVAGTYDLAATSARMAEEKQKQEFARRAFNRQREAQEKNIAAISAAIDKDPENIALLLERAQAYLGESFVTDLSYRPDHLVKSLQDYKNVLALDPGDTNHVGQHVEFFEAWQDRTDDRIERLKSFADRYPDSTRIPFAMYALFYDANDNGDTRQALNYITIADQAGLDGRFGEFLQRTRTTMEEKLEKR